MADGGSMADGKWSVEYSRDEGDRPREWDVAGLVKVGAAIAIVLYLLAGAFGGDSTVNEPPKTYTAPVSSSTFEGGGSCGIDSYENAYGECVRRPVAAPARPAGSTARCRDGTYSFSRSRSGTCSHHGGVASW